MDTASLFTAIALLILLVVTSPRFSIESRQTFRGAGHDRALSGVNEPGSPAGGLAS